MLSLIKRTLGYFCICFREKEQITKVMETIINNNIQTPKNKVELAGVFSLGVLLAKMLKKLKR